MNPGNLEAAIRACGTSAVPANFRMILKAGADTDAKNVGAPDCCQDDSRVPPTPPAAHLPAGRSPAACLLPVPGLLRLVLRLSPGLLLPAPFVLPGRPQTLRWVSAL